MTDHDTPNPEDQLKQLESELSRLSRLVYYDELTGVLNRRGFMEEAERVFHLVSYGRTAAERRTGFSLPLSLIYFDIDNFKRLNDTYGHAAGDEALKTVAEVMKKTLRAGDLCGRLGGEEFTVALVGASAHRAELIAEKLRTALEHTEFQWQEHRIPLTASFGVVEYGDHGSLPDLIDAADRAMYQAKTAGKNRVNAIHPAPHVHEAQL